jgi:hypothetical protein
MNTCATCQHWQAYDAPPHRPDLVGWGDCRLLGTTEVCHKQNRVCISGNSGGYGCEGIDVETHQEFGCVLHEERT